MGTLFRKTPNNGYPFPPKMTLKDGYWFGGGQPRTPVQTTSEYPPRALLSGTSRNVPVSWGLKLYFGKNISPRKFQTRDRNIP